LVHPGLLRTWGYFISGREKKATITETVRSRDVPSLVVYVPPKLTRQTFCTMRKLRRSRRLFMWRYGVAEQPRPFHTPASKEHRSCGRHGQRMLGIEPATLGLRVASRASLGLGRSGYGGIDSEFRSGSSRPVSVGHVPRCCLRSAGRSDSLRGLVSGVREGEPGRVRVLRLLSITARRDAASHA